MGTGSSRGLGCARGETGLALDAPVGYTSCMGALDGVRVVDFGQWIHAIHSGVEQTYAKFPFFGYGTDWLAFGHFVIAAFFVLPFTNPTRYRGVLRVGLAACAFPFSVFSF